MARWLLLLGGLLVWAAHFFSLYAIASIFPGDQIARWLAIIATVLALAGNSAIAWRCLGGGIAHAKGFEKWVMQLALAGALLSFIAVFWQGLPALI